MRDLIYLTATLSIALIFLSQIPLSSCQTSTSSQSKQEDDNPAQPHAFLYDPQQSGEWTELPTSHPENSIFSKFANKKGLAFLSAISFMNSNLVLIDSDYVDHERFIIIGLNIMELAYHADSSKALQNQRIMYQMGDDFYNFDKSTSHSCTVGEVIVKKKSDSSPYQKPENLRIQVKFTGGDCPFSFETNFLTKQLPPIEKFPRPFFNLAKAGRYYGKWLTEANQLISGWDNNKDGVAMTYFGTDGRPYLELLNGNSRDGSTYFGWENKTELDLADGKYLNEKYQGYVTIFLNLLEQEIEDQDDTGVIKKENHLIQYTHEIEEHTCIAKELTVTLNGSWIPTSFNPEASTIHIKLVMEDSCPLGSFETDSLTHENQLTPYQNNRIIIASYLWAFLSLVANVKILNEPKNPDHLRQLHLTAIVNMYCYEQLIAVATKVLGPFGLANYSFLLMSLICFEIYVIFMCYPPGGKFVTKVQNVIWYFGLRFLIYLVFPNNQFILSTIFFVIPFFWITSLFIKQFLENREVPRYPDKMLASLIITVCLNFDYNNFMVQSHHPFIIIAVGFFASTYGCLPLSFVFFGPWLGYRRVNPPSSNDEEQSNEQELNRRR